MKAAVYSATRNLYYDMIPSIKSLVMHSDVDRIFLLIEDDRFPFFLPDFVETRNISTQTYFSPASINYENPFTYMVLLRTALSKILPDCDRVLSLDCDTAVNQDISDLWDIDMRYNYYAAVAEHTKIFHQYSPTGPYYNAGVMLCNLELLRKDGMDDVMMTDLLATKYQFIEQDCINRNCAGRILELPSVYNDSFATERNKLEDIKIAHFAGTRQWQNNDFVDPHRLFKRYSKISWDEVFEHRKQVYGR